MAVKQSGRGVGEKHIRRHWPLLVHSVMLTAASDSELKVQSESDATAMETSRFLWEMRFDMQHFDVLIVALKLRALPSSASVVIENCAYLEGVPARPYSSEQLVLTSVGLFM